MTLRRPVVARYRFAVVGTVLAVVVRLGLTLLDVPVEEAPWQA